MYHVSVFLFFLCGLSSFFPLTHQNIWVILYSSSARGSIEYNCLLTLEGNNQPLAKWDSMHNELYTWVSRTDLSEGQKRKQNTLYIENGDCADVSGKDVGSQKEAQKCTVNKESTTLFVDYFIWKLLNFVALHKDISEIGQTHLQVSTSHFQAHRLPFLLSGRLPRSIREALGKIILFDQQFTRTTF